MNKPDLRTLARLSPLRQARAEALLRIVWQQRGVRLSVDTYESLSDATANTRQDIDWAVNDLAAAGLINLSAKDTVVEIIDPTEKVDEDA